MFPKQEKVRKNTMIFPIDPLAKPQLQATADFTIDMAITLTSHFDQYATDGVVSVEVTTRGLWLPNPYTHTRQFLGSAYKFSEHRHGDIGRKEIR